MILWNYKLINKQKTYDLSLKYSAMHIHVRYSVQGILLHKKNLSSLSHMLMMQLVYLMKVKKYFANSITSRCFIYTNTKREEW